MEDDESRPLLEEHAKESAPISRRFFVMLIVAIVVIFALVLVATTFSALYFHLLNKDSRKLPLWPDPSISPLGKYEKAAVAADNEYCSEIGRDVLLKGGNAVDAAIATLFCIGVMDSHSSGIGGGHFMTIYNATTRKCYVVDARETAPGAAEEKMYVDRWNESQIGWRAIAVPGELHGMWTEYTHFGGAISWEQLVLPTINLMEEGYPTSHALAKALKEKESWIRQEPTMKVFINPETHKVYAAGEQIKTRGNFIQTLKLIANPSLANATDPIDLFYHGAIAQNFTKEFKENGAILTLEDFRNYASIIRGDNGVIQTQLKNGLRICGPPPPSGSAVVQAILNILDGYALNFSTFNDVVSFYHRYIEASKFAYAARSSLGDMAFIKNALAVAKNITTKEYAETIRALITERAHPDSYYGGSFEGPHEDHGTAHISVLDAEGNAVSVTSTINLHLGAAVMSESTGILWNDDMDDFSTPGHPNYFGFPPSPSNFIRPGKRPMSSMSPIVVFNNDTNETRLSVGGAGGSTIISGVAGVTLHALWLDQNVKRSIDMPRVHNQLQPNYTQYESRFPQEYVEALRKLGHTMVSTANLTVVTAIEKGNDGVIYANSDFRKGEESAPAGY
ncbi:unnamed protein product [Toxocara canis]|uniref:Gamma-glutamyltranspeptidase 1 n=1 Tax=Toxocara canis TaxID=6265 RepID=A0A183USE6_TOXCA|nr:unnamed protein product [Toxocara canis]